ncbi:MAG: transcription-repair coupling factor [Lachnospiraceae bacterium]|nr:transcription-repair coupling factor [Lachnospiraceae bacterium]
MKLFDAPLAELREFEEVSEALKEGIKSVELTGCTQSGKLHFLHALGAPFDVRIILTSDDLKAKDIAEEYTMYDKNVKFFPAKDFIFYQADIYSDVITADRLKVLRAILEGTPITLVTTFDSLQTPMIPLEILQNHILKITVGSTMEEEAIAAKLTKMGYRRTATVEESGQFAIRGGIVDYFDLTEENPVRIELWGDEVDSIRVFDVQTQRSLTQIRECRVYPAKEFLLSKECRQEGFKRIEKEVKKQAAAFREKSLNEEAHRLEQEWKTLKEQVEEFHETGALEGYIRYFYPKAGDFFDLFGERSRIVFLDEPSKIDRHAEAVEEEFRDSFAHRIEKGYALSGQAELLIPAKDVIRRLKKETVVAFTILDFTSSKLPMKKKINVNMHPVASYNGSVEELLKDLSSYRKKGYRVLVTSSSRTRAKRLAESITDEGITAFYSDNKDRELSPGEVMTCYGTVRQGYEFPALKFVIMSDSDIFGKERKKKKNTKKYSGSRIHDFKELNVGDYVVHESYGVGVYRGIEKVQNDGITKDYMKIEYAGNSNLYVLASGFDAIMKYSSKEGKQPKLNKLGTQEWTKTKTKVHEAVLGVAKDLVELYAARQRGEGHRFSKDTVWQKEFEEMFPYEETEDQLEAIEATKADMESNKIMERLICGDVGYGKTEIAIRAAFKAVMDGYQVLFLVPTTILAEQHYNTFSSRMKDFPIRIELLSRFRTPTEQRKTVERLRKGLTDIVIGTHRILSKDIDPKNLGLLIIDEEQRFGVAHKEKLKKLRQNVDVLTLTATPIPRTLNMSLVGIRDMSVLDEAPQDRQPIQTFVMEYNEEMVREAIVRELARGGQVYYVHNRINDISNVAARVAALVPEARVAFAHGQMNERELEDIMHDFINGELDVLISTTIIETGLDISNVNTIIIDNSDRFGLAQLYQLRGRVGRSNRGAYAFLMYARDKILKEEAEKRLQAIREFTELGSGFKISMRDLEIRGAGNLLGMRQHGHMEAVGFELYCKMLNEAILTTKGEKPKEDSFETLVDLDINAYLPAEYIVNEPQKLEMYHKIASIEGKVDCEEFREELKDRFGELPKVAENLLRVALLKARAKEVYLSEIKGGNGKIKLSVKTDAPILAEKVPDFLFSFGGKMKYTRYGTPGFEYFYNENNIPEIEERQLLETAEMLVDRMRELYE